MSKQILKDVTSVGADLGEGDNAETKPDFIHQLSIARKKSYESYYGVKLLNESNYLTKAESKSINTDSIEVIKKLTSLLNLSKLTINH